MYEIGLGNHDPGIRRMAKSDNIKFWDKEAQKLEWFRKWDNVLEWNEPYARWFVGGLTNLSYNALDRHADISKRAIIWVGENGDSRVLTYGELGEQVMRAANVLKSLGVKRGDRVAIYLPMVPELIISMLACARIGAVHAVVFSGFSAASLRECIRDSEAVMVITADGGHRRGSIIHLKETVDQALQGMDMRVLVVKRTHNPTDMTRRDVLWSDAMEGASAECPAERLDSAHPLFILYTSGTTGKPKGILHGTGGYMTHVHSTFRWAFDIKPSDVYFCTADIGWVTGHSYVAYAPLLCGATQVVYEGAPDFPDPSRIWDIISSNKVSIFYTTPTAIRMHIKYGDRFPDAFDLSKLRLLGTVGEPINPEVWMWYHRTVGKGRCPIIDTWWQTETGGMLISPLPGIETIRLKPGSATRPVPGVEISVVDSDGAPAPADTKGLLVVKNRWPGIMMGLWNDDERYRKTYWSRFPGWYYSGDYAKVDSDGYIWLLGRADDVIKTSGHRIGTAEIESSIVSHRDVAESAVCGIPDPIKGERIAAFVVLVDGARCARADIISRVRKDVGPVATPSEVHFLSRLPKTRSGKIMRRLLKAAASGEDVGDTSTLEDRRVVDELRDLF